MASDQSLDLIYGTFFIPYLLCFCFFLNKNFMYPRFECWKTEMICSVITYIWASLPENLSSGVGDKARLKPVSSTTETN